jgi:cytochrome c biogenesis protein CcdA
MPPTEDGQRDSPRMAPVGPEELVRPRQSSRGIIAFWLGLVAWLSSCCLGPVIRLVQMPPSQDGTVRPQSGHDTSPEALGAAFFDWCCVYGIPLILALSAVVTGYEARRRQEPRLGWARAGVLIGFAYIAFVVLLVVGTCIWVRR